MKALWAIPGGKTDSIWEDLLLSDATDEQIERVKEIAARDGWHDFRVADIDLSAPPDFTKTINPEVLQ